MKTDEITRVLRSLRQRIVIREFLDCAVRATLFFFGVLLVLTAAAWWLGEFRPNLADIPFVLSWPFALGRGGGVAQNLRCVGGIHQPGADRARIVAWCFRSFGAVHGDQC